MNLRVISMLAIVTCHNLIAQNIEYSIIVEPQVQTGYANALCAKFESQLNICLTPPYSNDKLVTLYNISDEVKDYVLKSSNIKDNQFLSNCLSNQKILELDNLYKSPSESAKDISESNSVYANIQTITNKSNQNTNRISENLAKKKYSYDYEELKLLKGSESKIDSSDIEFLNSLESLDFDTLDLSSPCGIDVDSIYPVFYLFNIDIIFESLKDTCLTLNGFINYIWELNIDKSLDFNYFDLKLCSNQSTPFYSSTGFNYNISNFKLNKSGNYTSKFKYTSEFWLNYIPFDPQWRIDYSIDSYCGNLNSNAFTSENEQILIYHDPSYIISTGAYILYKDDFLIVSYTLSEPRMLLYKSSKSRKLYYKYQ
jgi:hypothetical protein